MAVVWETGFEYDVVDGDNLTDAALTDFGGNVLGAGVATQATFHEGEFAFDGQFSAKFIGTTTGDRFVSTSFTAQDEEFIRFYLYVTDAPGTLAADNVRIFRARASSTQTNANLFLMGDGRLRIGSGSNDNVFTTTGAWLNQWIRVEWRVASPPTGLGSQRLRVYAGANLNGTTVTEQSADVAVSTFATGIVSNQFGVLPSPLENTTFYMDQIVMDDTGWVGPLETLPVAEFTASTLAPAAGATVTFTNASQNATSYVWDFGDGTATSSATNPTHAFASSGTYSVSLTAINAAGFDEYSLTLVVGTPTSSPTAFDLSYESGTVGADVVESGYPVTSLGGTMKYVSTNPVKGSRAVEVDNTLGPVWMSSSFSTDQTAVWFREYITVTKLPIANPMVIAAAVSGGTGAVVARLVMDQHGKWSLWRGNSGDYGLLSAISSAASTPGILTRVEWRLNCATSIQTARIFVGSNAHGTTPDITVSGSLPADSVVSGMRWGNPQHSNAKYTLDGTAVGVTDWIGAISSPNAYSGIPTAGFVAGDLLVAKGAKIRFTNRSLGTPTSYAWNFGNGTGTATSPEQEYAIGGTFTVRLTATNAFGTSPATQLVVTSLDPLRGKAVPKVRVGGVWRSGSTTAAFLKIRSSGAWGTQGTLRSFKNGFWSSNELLADTNNPNPDTSGTGWGVGTGSRTTWYGSSLGIPGSNKYSRTRTNFGGLDATRTFMQKRPDSWNWSGVTNQAKEGMGTTSAVSWVSMRVTDTEWNILLQKTGTTTTQRTNLRNTMISFFDTFPTTYRIIVTFHHEPENDKGFKGNPSEWRVIQNELQDAVTASRAKRTTNKNWLKYASILMGYTFQKGSGRNPEDWRVDALDMWGYDSYRVVPQELSAQYAIDHGKAWGFGEVGNRQNGTDSAMYTELRDGIRMWTNLAQKPKVVTYWNATSTKSGSCWEIVLNPTSISGWKTGCPTIPARPNTMSLWYDLCTSGQLSAANS